MKRFANVADKVCCGREKIVNSCDGQWRGGVLALTNEEQSLLDLRRVCLPAMESNVRECERFRLVNLYAYVWTRLV